MPEDDQLCKLFTLLLLGKNNVLFPHCKCNVLMVSNSSVFCYAEMEVGLKVKDNPCYEGIGSYTQDPTIMARNPIYDELNISIWYFLICLVYACTSTVNVTPQVHNNALAWNRYIFMCSCMFCDNVTAVPSHTTTVYIYCYCNNCTLRHVVSIHQSHSVVEADRHCLEGFICFF